MRADLPSLEDLWRSLRSQDLERLIQPIASTYKESLRLTVADETEGPATRLGGRPNLPLDLEWPVWDKMPLAFVAQVDLSEIPSVFGPNLLKSGSLFFFYEGGKQVWGFRQDDRGGFKVLYTPDALGSHPIRSFPQGLSLRFQPVRLRAGRVELSIPDAVDQVLALRSKERYAYDRVKCEWSGCQGVIHRIGGYPDTIQNDPMLEAHLVSHGLYCGNSSGYEIGRSRGLFPGAKDWELLLQVDSEQRAGMMWGDGGRLYFMVHRKDLEKFQFDNAWLVLQCG